MLDLDEAKREMEEEEAVIEAEGNVEIVHKLANHKPKPERALTRNPSFFKRMLSSKKMSKIIAQVTEEDEKEDGKEDTAKRKNTVVDLHNMEDHDYIDPPMPFVGPPVNIELLRSRNMKAEFGLEKLMEMVVRDSDEAVKHAKLIPVSEHADRVFVTPEVSTRMAKVRAAKEIDKRVKENMNQIQKALNIRKSAVIIMNSNYSKQLVRRIEPIYVGEARTVTEHLGNEVKLARSVTGHSNTAKKELSKHTKKTNLKK